MNKSLFMWLGLALLIVLVIAGGLYFASAGGTGVTPSVGGNLAVPVNVVDNLKGSAQAKVVLVEYSDFECPACGAYYPLVEKLLTEFPNDLQFVYRHFPLPQHQGAIPGALAAEAAGRQGKFWEMYAKIFDNQSAWSGRRDTPQVFRGYAEKLDLDLTKFDSDLADKALSKKVDDQKAGGVAAGVNATPTFYLNSNKLNNPRSYDEFAALIKAQLGR